MGAGQGSDGDDPNIIILSNLVVALYRRGEFAEALAVMDRSEQEGNVYLNTLRGYVLAELPGGGRRAVEDFRVPHRNEASGSEGALFHQTVLRLLGRKSEAVEASREMRGLFSGMPLWLFEDFRPLLDYNCDLISAEELLGRVAHSRRRQCEGHFFIAITLLSEGNRAEAANHFKRSRETDVIYFYAYMWSRAFLERMERDPTWPPWIPLREGDAESNQE